MRQRELAESVNFSFFKPPNCFFFKRLNETKQPHNTFFKNNNKKNIYCIFWISHVSLRDLKSFLPQTYLTVQSQFGHSLISMVSQEHHQPGGHC